MKTKPDLPAWIPPQIWQDYEEMRKLIHKPMTDKARQLAFNRLEGFRQQGIDPVQVIEESILNSWQGLFAPRNGCCKREVSGMQFKSVPPPPEMTPEVISELRKKMGIKDWTV